MPRSGDGAAYPLVGSTGAGLAIDATGTPYDGLVRLKPELPSPPKNGVAYLDISVDPSAADASYDLILRDYTAASNIATVGASGAVTRARSSPVYGDIVFGNDLGLRVTVTTASATTGATAAISGYLYVEPRE